MGRPWILINPRKRNTPVALVGVQKPDGRSNQTRPHVAGAGTHTLHHPRPEPNRPAARHGDRPCIRRKEATRRLYPWPDSAEIRT